MTPFIVVSKELHVKNCVLGYFGIWMVRLGPLLPPRFPVAINTPRRPKTPLRTAATVSH